MFAFRKWFFLSVVMGVALAHAVPPSLDNLDASCHMNAAVQCLLNLNGMVTALLNTDQTLLFAAIDDEKQKATAQAFVALAKKARAQPGVSLLTELTALQKAMGESSVAFKEYLKTTGDPENTVSAVINALRPVLDSQSPNALGDYIFGMEFMTAYCDKNMVHYVMGLQPLDPSLRINFGKSVVAGLEQWRWEKMDVLPAALQKLPKPPKECFKERLLANVPEYLIIKPARYTLSTTGKAEGVFDSAPYEVPFVLDLNSYVTDEVRKSNAVTKYKLIGATVYVPGHHYAYIADQTQPNEPWYYCSDTSISLTDEKTVKEEVKNRGYLLFYRRLTPNPMQPFAESLAAISKA